MNDTDAVFVGFGSLIDQPILVVAVDQVLRRWLRGWLRAFTTDEAGVENLVPNVLVPPSLEPTTSATIGRGGR